MTRRIIVALMAASLLLTVGVGEAGAKKKKKNIVARHMTIAFQDLPGSSGDLISGQVLLGAPPPEDTDPNGGEPLAAKSGGGGARCLAGQTVVISHRQTAGEGASGNAPNVVATARTDANGFWSTTAFEANGAANHLLFDTIIARVYGKSYKHGKVRCAQAADNTTVFSY